jgi:hypothetical protein
VYHGYIKAAKDRGYAFNLTRAEFVKLTQQDCVYCGSAPGNVYKYLRKKDKPHGNFVYNGVDRIGNTVGYTTDNCVPCCGTCNKMKAALDVSTFIKHIKRIAAHQE